MLADDHPDRIQIAFDDHRLVANAGLILPATLGRHLGLAQLVDRHLDLGDAPGRANTGDKMMTLGMFLRSFAEPRSRSATPPRGLAGKPSAGFCTTPSRRITVVYGVIVYAIRFKTPSLHR